MTPHSNIIIFSCILSRLSRQELQLCKRKKFYLLHERLEPVHKIAVFLGQISKNCHSDHVIAQWWKEVGPTSMWFPERLIDHLTKCALEFHLTVMLLGVKSILKVLVFTNIFFKRSYRWRHYHVVRVSQKFSLVFYLVIYTIIFKLSGHTTLYFIWLVLH